MGRTGGLAPDQLRTFMREHGLTGSDVARLVGVNPRTVRRWLGGQIPMPPAAWYALHHKVTGSPPEA